MTLLFFDVFSAETKPFNWYLTTVFMCLLLGLIDYLYADLFVKKYNQINNLKQQQQDYEKLINENENLIKDLDKSSLVLEQSKQELSKTKESLQRTITNLEEANEKLTCPHCGQLQKSVSAYRNHIGSCKDNPKNKLNGEIKSISIAKES